MKLRGNRQQLTVILLPKKWLNSYVIPRLAANLLGRVINNRDLVKGVPLALNLPKVFNVDVTVRPIVYTLNTFLYCPSKFHIKFLPEHLGNDCIHINSR